MYQELVKYPAGTKKETVLYILLIVLGVFLVSILSWFLSEVTGQGWMEFLAFAALVLWAFRIYSKRIVEYRYSLMDTELIIARKVGSREKNIFTLEITDITRISAVEKGCKLHTDRFTLPTRRLKPVQIIYLTDGQDKRVILQPSDHLLQLIRVRAAFKEPKTSAE